MARAIERARVAPRDIAVVYASANSSAALDAVEAAAIGQVFSGGGPLVTTVKGSLGEASAQGAAAIAAAVLCGRRGLAPPVAGLGEVDGAATHLNLSRSATPLAGPLALVNAIASGGALASAVVRVRG
jgi:3-oxoacyl-(acyl-carrier-protein) synthase